MDGRTLSQGCSQGGVCTDTGTVAASPPEAAPSRIYSIYIPTPLSKRHDPGHEDETSSHPVHPVAFARLVRVNRVDSVRDGLYEQMQQPHPPLSGLH